MSQTDSSRRTTGRLAGFAPALLAVNNDSFSASNLTSIVLLQPTAIGQVQRFSRARVLALARSMGLAARLRSQDGGPEPVIILDTIGELVRAYVLGERYRLSKIERRLGRSLRSPATIADVHLALRSRALYREPPAGGA